ncbi:leucine/isoleucine/valine transporter subunit; ATP-binding component of ABC superfamily [Mesorhizobium metallidurans STM 2683]|uniref:Leucine/isoleucine/valine transporter subunit ATP-binding component of ABC superfamily n=1 Tax=Mesorhizobium metallidurans STM 2683 TaxID=1297569 RepID=M5F796_9HYPH|nr:ABC transporter ATP-binding protein [Mesorhizobium metallidurans]CCV07771.1 leucine/isoleucine/valine transporter subunit; ATP-binding component of ABC superfamily [Mesorhizobium metallidurans STM 2683]
MLKVENLGVRYGAVAAVRDLSLSVGQGELVALLGPNGAGKSSTINALTGLVAPSAGRIVLDGQDISRVRTEDRIRAGLTSTPEGRRIFANLTVGENLRLGAATRRDPKGVRQDMERFLALFPVLSERYAQAAGTLSGGEQQMLAIARSLMSRPKLLLLDEPSLGLAPKIVVRIFDFIGQLKAEGLTLLVVEQNARQALRFADRVYVMSSGVLRFDGPPSGLADEHGLLNLYIGG